MYTTLSGMTAFSSESQNSNAKSNENLLKRYNKNNKNKNISLNLSNLSHYSNLSLKELETTLSITSSGVDKVKARRIIERIKQLTTELELISKNRRE